MNTQEMNNRANKTRVLEMLEKARRIILGEVVIQELEEANIGRTARDQIPPEWPELDPLKVQALELIGFTVTDEAQLVFSISQTGLACIAPGAIDIVISSISKGFPTTAPRRPRNGRTHTGTGGQISPGWSLPYPDLGYEVLLQRIEDMTANVARSSGKIQSTFNVELELLEGLNELM